MKHYNILSPDGFTTTVEDTYTTKEEARNHAKVWAKSFETQGFYSSSKYGRIPYEEILDYCVLTTYKDGRMVDSEDAKLVLTNELTELCETVADIAYAAGAKGWTTEDSRYDVSLFISWAMEFESTNCDPEGEGDYIDRIEAFVETKLTEDNK